MRPGVIPRVLGLSAALAGLLGAVFTAPASAGDRPADRPAADVEPLSAEAVAAPANFTHPGVGVSRPNSTSYAARCWPAPSRGRPRTTR